MAHIGLQDRRRKAAVRHALVVMLLGPGTAAAVTAPPAALHDPSYGPSRAFVTDGSTVMNAGELHMHLTNWGLIGSAPGWGARFSDAPSAQWPAGSGVEYLHTAGLWVGGRVFGEKVVSMGGLFSEWLPRDEVEATLYEAVNGQIVRPIGNPGAGGNRKPMPDPDDDGDGLVDEETLNGHDDDDDGAVDEDFGQIGSQMMVCTVYDDTRLAQERYPDHTPLHLEAVQSAFQWENDAVDDFVGFDYTITNVGVIDAEQIYIGFFADCDVGPRGLGDVAGDDMAGSWQGMVRASDGGWVPVDVGYMYDAAEYERVDGYFGILFLGHDVDPTGRNAPQRVGLRTFQSFSSNAAFEQGGDPANDEQAYELLSAQPGDRDADTRPGNQADFRILVSAGPFRRLEPGRSLGFQVAMVCGAGLGTSAGGRGLLAHCAEAWLTWHGIFVDELDQVATLPGPRFNPGRRGRETMLCLEDFGPDTSDNPFYSFLPDFMDTSCIDPLWAVTQRRVASEDMFHHDGKTCAMFNMDNCFECARQLGRECVTADFESGAWTCRDSVGTRTAGCTGVDGLETQIHWLVGMAPPPPGMRLWPDDGRVHVYWDDSSEHAPDVRLQAIDFESYRIWRADNWSRPFGSSLENGPQSGLWRMIAEFDVVNDYVTRLVAGDTAVLDTLPLGRNTGLEPVAYRPGILDDPRYEGLAAAMQEVVDADRDGLLRERPELRDEDGVPLPPYVGLLPWETESAVLDTFFAVAARPGDPAAGIVAKRGTRYYEYVDREIHNGFLYFYAVTATDHVLAVEDGVLDEMPRGPGQAGDPGSSFAHGVPGTAAQTPEERSRLGANIFVYPNPATREALNAYQQLDPTGDDPTGVRVTFANLPAARNTIRIYTVAGDLVQELQHDGTTGAGHASWNLMSRNRQEIVSGVYLYSVQSDDRRFGDFVGRFVVVR